MRKILLSITIIMVSFSSKAQSLIPFAFTSEDDNRFIKENDSFKCYVATGDTAFMVCISDEPSYYKLLNREGRIVSEGAYTIEGDKYLQEGKWTARYESGKPKLTGYYHKGNPVGTWEEYYGSGKLKKVFNYGLFTENGEVFSCLSGSYQEYYQSGKMKINGFYAGNVTAAYDTVTVTDPETGKDVYKTIPRKKLISQKAGQWEYYTEEGELDKKQEF